MKQKTLSRLRLAAVVLAMLCYAHNGIAQQAGVLRKMATIQGRHYSLSFLDEETPLVLQNNGVLMPAQSLWFLAPDSTHGLYSFTISEKDTSFYCIRQEGDSRVVVRIKSDGAGRTREQKIMKLGAGHFRIYPTRAGCFYISRRDTLTSIAFYDGSRLVPLYKSKDTLQNIQALDNGSFIAFFRHAVLLCQAQGAPVSLFTSGIPMISGVADSKGRFYVSTRNGIFFYDVAASSDGERLNIPLNDALLAIFHDSVFALSNNHAGIFRIYH